MTSCSARHIAACMRAASFRLTGSSQHLSLLTTLTPHSSLRTPMAGQPPSRALHSISSTKTSAACASSTTRITSSQHRDTIPCVRWCLSVVAMRIRSTMRWCGIFHHHQWQVTTQKWTSGVLGKGSAVAESSAKVLSAIDPSWMGHRATCVACLPTMQCCNWHSGAALGGRPKPLWRERRSYRQTGDWERYEGWAHLVAPSEVRWEERGADVG